MGDRKMAGIVLGHSSLCSLSIRTVDVMPITWRYELTLAIAIVPYASAIARKQFAIHLAAAKRRGDGRRRHVVALDVSRSMAADCTPIRRLALLFSVHQLDTVKSVLHLPYPMRRREYGFVRTLLFFINLRPACVMPKIVL